MSDATGQAKVNKPTAKKKTTKKKPTPKPAKVEEVVEETVSLGATEKREEPLMAKEREYIAEPPAMAKKDKWEMKDRIYKLKRGNPVARKLRSKNITWVNPENGDVRELKAASNQSTPFVDEMVGQPRLEHLVFRGTETNGCVLFVPKEKKGIQVLLSKYHPDLNKLYYEVDEGRDAIEELEQIDKEFEALKIANDMEFIELEAIVWSHVGGAVDRMSTFEVKRDAKRLAKSNPDLFIQASKSEYLLMTRVAAKAVAEGIIRQSSDKRRFFAQGSGESIVDVPIGENPYEVLAGYFNGSSDGYALYERTKKKLS